uniref:KN motif and ankyrin repeat domain-containing protein 4 n=1 Tax=Geotrypetes seraphini TaxID=260995 RepID=A0A6P8PBT3_GEOSA|nr:KN motif and ankyrin repeat domain-containing protein 4 [Geotrypetes seraphini]XP_033772981.1 KN motif and ankyrin repeat domain-containing protein 4 [Geotrypetes seraphini]XP_033772982.1 KN motif and ankyrin repeat domain-containing protein 4 [Geotrypetes seraphini]XP_033772983.1 KN motif and ankyrin repeat domain-containing protein 4 [Geotrypetes seraphini]XP_033772984.1 KN motif and ankyrin repeat domain-containing protein 4 [Geotrypetes seraphini]XP_033772985.1 KN motif and ankyrin repe
MEKICNNNQISKSGEKKREQLAYSVETPYGFYLDLDFLKYVDDIEKGNTIKKVHVHRKSKQPKFSTLPRNFGIPNSEPRPHVPPARKGWISTTPLPAQRKEVTDLREILHVIPNSDPAHSLRQGYELKYREESDEQAEQIHPDEKLNSLRSRPQLLRASSMPATLIQHKSSEELNQYSLFSQSPLPFQPSILSQNTFPPVDASLDPQCYTNLESTHLVEKSNMQMQIQEALKRMKELEGQVKTIPELNQKISLLSEEKIQLALQLQNLWSRALESETNAVDMSNGNCGIKAATETLPLCSVSTQTTFIPDNMVSENLELSITENELLTDVGAESRRTSDGVREENIRSESLLYVRSESTEFMTLMHQFTTLERNLRDKTDELEKLKLVVKEQEMYIKDKDISLEELAWAKDLSLQEFLSLKMQLEEASRETKISYEPDGCYCQDVAVNTEEEHEDKKRTLDKCINVSMSTETQSVGCGDYDVNMMDSQVKASKDTITFDKLVDVDFACKQDQSNHITTIDHEKAGNCIKSDMDSCSSDSFASTVLKIDEPVYDCPLRTISDDEQFIAGASVGEPWMHENQDTFFAKEEVEEKEYQRDGQSLPAETPIGQYVKKIQELLQEQWTCLEHGYPELAKAIRQPASKLSSIQNQLVSSLNLLSSICSSEAATDDETSVVRQQPMATSPSTSLKSIMKRKNYSFHAGGNGTKKNLQFVGVNGGYETTSSEDTSYGENSSEGSTDSDVEAKGDASEGEHLQSDSKRLEAEYETTQYAMSKDQEEQEMEHSASGSARHSPERCVIPEAFLNQCQLLSNHLSEMGTITDEELRQSLKAVCQEWFRVSSRKSSSSETVAAYLETLRSVNAQLLETIVNMADRNRNTALHYSISHSNFSIVKLLLDTGVCDVDCENKAGYTAVMLTPLASAQTNQEMEVVLKLLNQGNINTRASQGGQTALMLAVSHGRADMVGVLLSCGADINVQDDEGRSALMMACECGHVEIAKLLLAQPECDAQLTDKGGKSALSLVPSSAHSHIAELLEAHTEHSAAPSL